MRSEVDPYGKETVVPSLGGGDIEGLRALRVMNRRRVREDEKWRVPP